MNRGLMQVAVLALLGVAAACNRQSGLETGMSGSASASASTQPGDVVAVDSLGHGSGGHLKSAALCHYENGILVCTFVSDSGLGSGGHYPVRVALVMNCSGKGPGKELECSAPVGGTR
jgi:hypothetical protein